MNDKKFDEIMQKYVASKTRGQEIDFVKLNEKMDKMDNVVIKKNKKRLVLASISFIVVIAVALAIVLPLTLPSSSDNTPSPNTQYFDEQNLSILSVYSMSDIANYNIVTTLPTILCQNNIILMLLSKADSTVVGAHIDIAVFDKIFDNVNMYILPEDKMINDLVFYTTCPMTSNWMGNTVKYFTEFDEDLGYYRARIFIKMNGYKYFIETQHHTNLPVEELLDLIF